MKATPLHRIVVAALALVVATAATATTAAAGPLPRFGVMADLGVPDGGTASIVMRARMLRVHGGVSHNLVSRGVRGGITLAPFTWAVTPTISLEYGHYLDGDANPILRMVTGDPTFSSPLLERVGYDYANAHLGLEFGQRWATFYIHAGVSLIRTTIHGLDGPTADASTTVTLTSDPGVTVWSVSARLGFIFYLLK